MININQIKSYIDEYLTGLLINDDEQNPAAIQNLVFEIAIPSLNFLHPIALGRARADSDVPMTPAHLFHIASITKTMTAVLILQLWENGAFGSKGLDVSLAELSIFKPEVLRRLHVKNGVSHASAITLKQLLTHTAGLKDPYSDDAKVTAAENKNQPAPGSIAARWQADLEKLGAGDSSLDEHSALIYKNWTPWDPTQPDNPDAGIVNYYLNNLGDSPVALPGEVYHYSDTGFVILALIAEKISAKSYHRLLRQNIFTPTGMDSAYLAYAEEPGTKQNLISDCYAGPFPMVSGGFNFSFDWGGGGVVTTASDLNKFLQALINGRLFKKAVTLEEMLNWKTYPGLTNTNTGLGIFAEKNKKSGTILWGHDGAWGSVMYHEPASGIFISGTINQLFGAPAGWLDKLFDVLHKGIS